MTLYYYEETTMKEIGLILGIAEPRVSQIRASAVLHLRARLSAPMTSGQRQGDQNHSDRVISKSFRNGASARKPESSGYAKAAGCR
jgi:Sigma-70, region 4